MAKENEEKGSKVLSEIKAFITLVFIIGLVSVGGWYWYTHFYTPNKNVKENEQENTNVAYKVTDIKAEGKHLIGVLNDKYVYEYDDQSFDLFKVMGMDGKVLFEGKEKYSYFYEGIDGEFYVVKEELADNENVISLYKIIDNKIELIKKIAQSNVYFEMVLYRNVETDIEKLIGVYGNKISIEDGNSKLENAYYYNLEGKEFTTDEFHFGSDEASISIDASRYTFNDKYMIIYNDDDSSDYGLLDLEKFEVVIEPSYDRLYTTSDGKYVAIKNEKAGIIDVNQKKIVDFEYDFIDRNNGFYVVGKDDKMAIMDENYKLVSDFEFDYQTGGLPDSEYIYILCCTKFNTFEAYKVGEKYVLITNAYELSRHLNYDKSITYVIKSDGSYDSINANDFVVTDDLIYSYSKKEFTVYDKSMTPKYSIDASGYDFGSEVGLVRFGNTLAFEGKKIYFDYETGEEVDEPIDYEYALENVKIQYSDGKVKILIDDKEEGSYEYEPFEENEFVHEIDNGVYYLTENEIIIVKK